ncbi:MAG: SDR family NAD(P)-dependent oxidoreductase [Chloroflexi bacterium]|nr:SDR family NAD(P)-dependent oxidoreductase [Chloroflexota bacterium]
MESIVVTGVSTGIGKATTQILTERGYRVFGSVRRQLDADQLRAELGEAFVPLLFDVTDEPAVRAAANQVREALQGQTLFGLVNNAGVAVPAPMLYIPIEDFRKQIEINLTGQLIVIQAFVPLLGAEQALKGKPGRIVNISSISGRNGSPFLGAYAASKHALEGMSESLRREMILHGIDVIIVAPGPIATPIWEKAEHADLDQYKETEFYAPGMKFQKYAIRNGQNGLPAQTVAKVALKALTAKHPRVRYAVNPNPFMSWIMSSLPKRMVDAMIAKGVGLKKQSLAR